MLDADAIGLVDEDLPQPCCPNMVFGEAQAEPGEPVARGCIVAAVQRDMMDRAAATRSHRGLLVIARKGEACGPHMDRGMAVAVQHTSAVAEAVPAGRRRGRKRTRLNARHTCGSR